MATKTWRPHKRQADFIALPDSFFEGFYGGAAGGGKSDVILMLPIVREFYKVQSFKGIIFRRTFPELEESLIHRTKTGIGFNSDGTPGPSYYDFGGQYNDTKHRWTFESGAVIHFSFMETDDDARSHDTAEYNYIGFDELTAFEEFQYVYLTSRCRSSNPALPKIIRSASNPGNIGHGWVLNRFVKPAPKGYKPILNELSKTKSIFIPAKISDNPSLKISDPGYEDRLNLLPESERKAKKDGDWFVFSGQVFTEWRNAHRPGEPENALHVIPANSMQIPDWWPRIMALDWGYTAMTYALWAAISPDERVILYREYAIRKTSIDIWGAELARICSLDPPLQSIEIDPSSNQNRGQGMTIKAQFLQAFNDPMISVHDADNDRIGGRMLIHDFLRFNQRPKRYVPKEGYNQELADQILRIHGVKALADYKLMFMDEPDETNLPKLLIFNTCSVLINAIPLCIFDQRHPEDIAEFDGDDPIDTLRYLLKSVYRYTHTLQDEFRRRKQVAEIVADLEQNQDQTSFYRRMEFLEAKERQRTRPVYH